MEKYKEDFPVTVNSLISDTYVDDVQSVSDMPTELVRFKNEASEIMEQGGFQLHKWHSTISNMENVDGTVNDTKLPGTPWNKR